MLRILPVILVVGLIIGGLGYFRFVVSKPSLTTPKTEQSQTSQDNTPLEVPKTLPQATMEDRVKALEELTTKLVTQVNVLKPANGFVGTTDSQLNLVEASVTELKMRVSALEKVSPAPAAASTNKSSVVYIPLGSGGGPWGNTDWYSMPEYEISLDPANYPGYSGMVLEVTFRLVESAGTGSVRLYNTTDSSTTSSQLDSTSATYTLKTSSSFKLPSGSKTYRLQVKSSQNKDLFIQSARIKVNF